MLRLWLALRHKRDGDRTGRAPTHSPADSRKCGWQDVTTDARRLHDHGSPAYAEAALN